MPALPRLPEGRRGGAAGALYSSILYCGGRGGAGDTVRGECWVLEVGGVEWEVAPSLLHPVAFPAHAVVGGGLYLAGGLGQDGAPVAHVQVVLLSGMHFGANCVGS